MKMKWFTRKGLIYWPASIVGWIILIITVAGAIYTFIDIDGRSHSVSDTLINFVFNLLLIGLVYTIIAFFAELKPNSEPES